MNSAKPLFANECAGQGDTQNQVNGMFLPFAFGSLASPLSLRPNPFIGVHNPTKMQALRFKFYLFLSLIVHFWQTNALRMVTNNLTLSFTI